MTIGDCDEGPTIGRCASWSVVTLNMVGLTSGSRPAAGVDFVTGSVDELPSVRQPECRPRLDPGCLRASVDKRLLYSNPAVRCFSRRHPDHIDAAA